jgi:ankyrin repeat protein
LIVEAKLNFVDIHSFDEKIDMPLLATEKTDIEQTISKTLRDVSHANPFRLKAGIRILMTTNLQTFESICSESVKKDLSVLTKIISNPETIAPNSTKNDIARTDTLNFIKQFTLNNLHLLDDRTAILPNTIMVQKSIMEGERLKSVVHASAMRNIVTNANYVDTLVKRFQQEKIPADRIQEYVDKAITSTQGLHKAVLEGDITKVLTSLATHGVDVNYPDEKGLTPLHIAVREGLTETVKLLLTVPNVQVGLVSNNGWTPIHMAARMGHADIVDALLTMPQINPNAVNSDGWCALHWAAWQGSLDVVTVLLTAHGININQQDRLNTTPLHLAARSGHADIIKVLLSISGIDINCKDNEQKTPLHYATTYNHEEAVNALIISPEVDLNALDMDGLSPLHWAARNGNLEIVNALLAQRNTLTDILDNNGMNPLEWAMRNGHASVIQRLKPYYPNQSSKVSPLMSTLKKVGQFLKKKKSNRIEPTL